MSAPTVDESARLTAALVLLDGHRLPLRGADRIAAVQLALSRGMTREEAAARLRIPVPTFAQWARRAGVAYPLTPQTIEAWARCYTEASQTPAARARRRRARRAAA